MIKVKFTEKYIKEEDDVVVSKYNTKEIETNFIQQYNNAIGILYGLSNRSRKILDYCVNAMDKSNIIRLDKYGFNAVNSILEDNGQLQFKRSNFTKGILELTKSNLLFREAKGVYMVNPEYYNNTTEHDRIKKIQITLSFQSGSRTTLDVRKSLKNEDVIISNK